MKISILNNLQSAQKEFIFRLWNKEYPERLAFASIADLDAYLAGLKNPTHYFAENETGQFVAWAPVFERENEKWFAMILDSAIQRQGIGTQLLNTITKKENELNGWAIDHDNDLKLNGDTYYSPLNFYKKNKFLIFKNTRLETEKLSAVKIKWSLKPID